MKYGERIGNFIDEYLEKRILEKPIDMVITFKTGSTFYHKPCFLIPLKEENNETKKQNKELTALENLQRSFWQF